MGIFSRAPSHENLRGYKKLTIKGMRFVIKKLNPILDFSSDKIPQIFTDFVSTRSPLITTEVIRKHQLDMQDIIRLGVVDPELKPNGTKNALTPDDMFRDPTIGIKLYFEILNHSLNHFRGLNKLFFSIGIKLSCLTFCASGMGKDLAIFSSQKENLA